METPKELAHIKGWGIDIDPKNDPTYPIKRRTNEEHKGLSWPRPTQQPETVEILHSIERPNLTAVFGTTVPPSGLSGIIRRLAFKYSENHYGHWLPLILADRVNVVEGILEDFVKGKFPNIYAEKGYPAEWEHNKSGLMMRLGAAALLTGAVVALAVMNSKKDDND